MLFDFSNTIEVPNENLSHKGFMKIWIKKLSVFENFLNDKAELYVVRLENNRDKYTDKEQKILNSWIIQSIKDGDISKNASLDNLVFVAEVDNVKNVVINVIPVDIELISFFPNLVEAFKRCNCIHWIW